MIQATVCPQRYSQMSSAGMQSDQSCPACTEPPERDWDACVDIAGRTFIDQEMHEIGYLTTEDSYGL